jgi:hypothetical protein
MQTFVCLPGLCRDVILGRDFLERSNISIHIGRRGWTVGTDPQEVVPFEKSDGSAGCLAASEPVADVVTELGRSLTCSQHMRGRMLAVLETYREVFSKRPGTTNLYCHEIDTGGAAPVRCRQRPISDKKRKILDECIDNLLRDDIIEPCVSAWGNAPVLVLKKDGGHRLCLDYRGLNRVTQVSPWPMPRVDWTLAQLGQAQVISTLDLAQGYHQIVIAPHHRAKTAMVTHRGVFRYKKMSLGLKGASFSFQRCMDAVLEGAAYKYANAFLDDVVVYSKSWEEHVVHLADVLDRLKRAGLTVNPSKVQLGAASVKFLGHIVEPGSVSPDPSIVTAIEGFQPPGDVRGLQRFLGLVGFFRDYVPSFSAIALPLTSLLCKKAEWRWGDKEDEAFRALRASVTASSCLALPDMDKEFRLFCDASFEGLGCALLQEGPKGLRPIAFASRALTPAEKNYHITELEALSVVWGVQRFQHYLEMSHFVIETDHESLKTMLTSEWPTGRVKRWALRLMGLDCQIQYRRGKLNTLADCLSRAPVPEAPRDDAQTPARWVNELLPIEDVDRPFAHQNPFGRLTFEGDQSDVTVAVVNLVPPLDLSDLDMWRETQREDVHLAAVREALEAGVHTDASLSINRDGLIVKNLPSERDSNTEAAWKTLVPAALRKDVLCAFHDHPLAGHGGVAKTLLRLQDRFFWDRMRQDVKAHVRGCDPCQRTKPRNSKPRGLMDSRAASEVGTHVSVDLMGPYPRSKRGHQYLFVIVDDFSKFMEVYPLRLAKTRAVVECLMDYCCRYGFPESVRSDNGPQFVSNIWTQLCEQLGIVCRRVVPYRPKGNLCERTNRNLKQCVVAITKDHRDWDMHIAEIVFALRSASHQSTGYSPAFLTFGRELATPFDRMGASEDERGATTRKAGAYVEALVERLAVARRIAVDSMSSAREAQRKIYDAHRQDDELAIGELVLRDTHVLSNAAQGIAASLAKKRDGPWVVTSRLGRNVYRVADPTSGRHVGRYNIDQLTRYRTRPEWPAAAGKRTPPKRIMLETIAEEDEQPRHGYATRSRGGVL